MMMDPEDYAAPADFDERLDDLIDDGDPGGGGQSGDTQGLSNVADVDSESVEELAETGQSYEADIIRGLEDAADHPERPVPAREEFA